MESGQSRPKSLFDFKYCMNFGLLTFFVEILLQFTVKLNGKQQCCPIARNPM